MNRRDFVVGALSSTSLFLLSRGAMGHPGAWIPPSLLTPDISPLQRLNVFGGSPLIEGDTHDEAHEIFWNKEGYIGTKGGIPRTSAHYDVVVLGGGLAGLNAAYNLPQHKLLVLDGHPRLGGNAKTQYYGRAFASLGSAYITRPEAGGLIDNFLGELRLKERFREVDHSQDVVEFQGRFLKGFWDGVTDPARSDDFRRVRAEMARIWDNEYPELPIWAPQDRPRFDALDRMSFERWIRQHLGQLHPHVLEYLYLYCWSSFSAPPEELSAAQALNFIVSDMAGTQALPGGNGLIAQALYERLAARRNATLRAPCFGVDVALEGGKARVCFKNERGELETVTADKCVLASPKMVMKHVVSGLPAGQERAMDEMSYRAYLVANVFMRKKIPSQGYDVFSQMGRVPTHGTRDSRERAIADITFADWAMRDTAEKSILTLYMPLPYDMAQQFLFIDGLYQKYHDKIRERLSPALVGMGLSWADVEGVRLVRYGHSMPQAQVGGVATGLFERAHADIADTLFFANQDNWGSPCFETSFVCGLQAALKIKGEA